MALQISIKLPWVEKHRPKVLSDVVGNKQTLIQLQTMSETKNMPNLLLCGPPGTGKTTSVVAIARQILTEDKVKEGCLELNASDDRGIEVVRDKIKNFCKKVVAIPSNTHKIVILDEADSLTESAQQALRLLMTDQSRDTRFALACNDSSKIIEPIQSRCAILRQTRLTDEQILERVLKVCDLENVTQDNKGLEALVFTAEGDMRNALNNLQATYQAYGHVTMENILKVCDTPHPELINNLIDGFLKPDFNQSYLCLETLLNKGFSSNDVTGNTIRILERRIDLDKDEHLKLGILRELSIMRLRIVEGCSTSIQLGGTIAKICTIVENYKSMNNIQNN